MRSLSPQRRLFVIGLLVVALLASTAVAVSYLRRPGGTADQAVPGPVLLVPGYGGSETALQPLAARLREAGREVVVVSLPDGGTGDLRAQGDVLDAAVRRLERDGAPSVDIVGYSAGGVVARLWVQEHDGERRARRIVTLGSPHHGTELAATAQALLGGCDAACTELAPGSDTISGLNRGDETPPGPAWVAVWTTADRTVVPARSGVLAGALDVRLQDVCPGSTTPHGGLPKDPAVIGLVLAALASAPPTAPPARSCRTYQAAGTA